MRFSGIRCEWPGCMTHYVDPKCRTASQLRRKLKGLGLYCRDGFDLCPGHREEAKVTGSITRDVADIRERLGI